MFDKKNMKIVLDKFWEMNVLKKKKDLSHKQLYLCDYESEIDNGMSCRGINYKYPLAGDGLWKI